MGLIRDLIHAGGTGGLSWHVQAYASRKRWQPTVQLIEQFLTQVQPMSEHLVLIGASAGWMMPPPWLARFQRIDAYDIDPISAWLFDIQHGKRLKAQGMTVHHHRQDALATLPDLLNQHPKACVWFDNVLGQHRFRVRDEAQAEQDLARIKTTLQGRSWGSLHDVWSGPTDGRLLPAGLQVWRHDVTAKQALTPDFSQKLLASVGAKEAWHDHLSSHVFAPNTPTTWMPWAFKPNYWHWLQAGWVNP